MTMTGKPDPGPHQLWRHHKGSAYVVVCVALREYDRVPVVVYRGGEEETWVRPLGEFLAKFEFEGEVSPLEPMDHAKKLIGEALALLGTI